LLNQEENASNISLNRITPMDDDEPFAKMKKTRFRRKEASMQKTSEIHN